MFDISTQDNLQKYLVNRGLLKNDSEYSIHYCKGGVSCTVAYVVIDDKPMIIKQALEQLKTKEVWICDPNRMFIEYESNRIYYEIMPQNAPETYFYDDENYIYGREAVPDGCLMWKDYLMKNDLNYSHAVQAVDTLVSAHNFCHDNLDVMKKFDDKDVFYNLRISPYFEFTANKYPQLKSCFEEIIKIMMESKISLIHGDYSPKNIMIVNDEIKVLDYEVACYGHPAFDLAFFSNHFILKAVLFDEFSKGYLDMLDIMVKRYFEKMTFMSKEEFEPVFVKTLAILMLARIDGKSPVEYLVGNEAKQNLVRKISIEMMESNVSSFKVARNIINKSLNIAP